MQTSISATGACPADAVWERYADLDRWPDWAPQISGVAVTVPAGDGPSRRIAPGMRGPVRAVGLLHVAVEVLEVDEVARTWSWRVRVGPVRLHLDHGVEATAAGGTRTWLRTTGPAPVVAPYTPVALIALHSLVMDR